MYNNDYVIYTLHTNPLFSGIAKQLTIFPYEDDHSIFYEEGDNTLHCSHCYPACNDTNYDILSWRNLIIHGIFESNLL